MAEHLGIAVGHKENSAIAKRSAWNNSPSLESQNLWKVKPCKRVRRVLGSGNEQDPSASPSSDYNFPQQG